MATMTLVVTLTEGIGPQRWRHCHCCYHFLVLSNNPAPSADIRFNLPAFSVLLFSPYPLWLWLWLCQWQRWLWRAATEVLVAALVTEVALEEVLDTERAQKTRGVKLFSEGEVLFFKTADGGNAR